MIWLKTLEPLILTLHFVLCLFMIVTILLQAGKGADIGAAFGAGSSQTLFGPRGAATLLSKITTVAALMFLVTSVSLATLHKNRASIDMKDSVIERAPEEKPVQVEPEEPTDQPPPVP